MLIENKKWKNIILINASAFLLVILLELIPRFSAIINQASYLHDQNKKIERANENITNERQLISVNKKLKSLLSSTISDYEGNSNISAIIKTMDDIAARTNVDLLTITPKKVIKRENIWIQPYEITLSSGYEGIYNYIRNLENSSKIITLRSLILKPQKPLSDSLIIKTNLDVYLNL